MKPHNLLALLLVILTAWSPAAMAKNTENFLNSLKPLMTDYLLAQCKTKSQCSKDAGTPAEECTKQSKELAEMTFEQMHKENIVVIKSQIEQAKRCTSEILKSSCIQLSKGLPPSCEVWDSWDNH